MRTLHYRRVDSPIGPLLLAASHDGLAALYMQAHRHVPDSPEAGWKPVVPQDGRAWEILADADEQLAGYFAGARTTFDLPLDVEGTPFQKTVWAGLRDIPFGATISYAELARRIGNPKAMRAVGLANGRNPVSIVVPCHRVIGANGSLTGYGGGIERKRFLLALEGAGGPAGQLALV